MKISKEKKSIKSSTSIMAAEEDSTEAIGDTIDSISDDINDLQDTIDEVEEDDVDIELDNNITNHFIAECDRCHGIFISALVMSDQKVKTISGICPVCNKETDQSLKWIIKDV